MTNVTFTPIGFSRNCFFIALGNQSDREELDKIDWIEEIFCVGVAWGCNTPRKGRSGEAMTSAIARSQLTFAEYLSYDDGTDARYELSDGQLVEMPPENLNNCLLARFLFVEFLKFFPLSRVCMKDTEIEVSGRRAKTRYPDVMILSEELEATLQGISRSTITRDMPPPQMVVEIVSPGKENEDRDYRYKRSEYAARGIVEYWIVDPEKQQVTVLNWVEGLYEETVFTGKQPLLSLTLPNLNLTAEQILKTGE